ncbi:MAG: acyl-CoA reductase [Flavobacteriales bacterium]|nr:acyl-CoA reductase [Flavobacteriales bacterium]
MYFCLSIFRYKGTVNSLKPVLSKLGIWFREQAHTESELLRLAEANNGWFTHESVAKSFQSHGSSLQDELVDKWLDAYQLPDAILADSGKRIGIIMAGNLPLVGLHDMLCALVAGHKVAVKTSRDDTVLPKRVVQEIESIEPALKGRIEFVEGKLGDVDALIATGSSNTMRYFDAYFGHIPHVFRTQRTGVAVLDGEESPDELKGLGDDMFTHFGLGCRSTTKVFLPTDFDLDRCFAAWVPWSFLANNNKYANNYDYHKAIWLLNREELIENGFLLVKEDENWVSPVGTLFVERYDDVGELIKKLSDYKDGLQLVTSRSGATEFTKELSALAPSISQQDLGLAQCPSLSDYADGVDSVEFLLKI